MAGYGTARWVPTKPAMAASRCRFRVTMPVLHAAISTLCAGKLQSALVAQGLFPDEARAMLETWQLSYFASEGDARVFPAPASVDRHASAALDFSSCGRHASHDGENQLISAHQRAALEQLYGLPAEAFDLPPVFLAQLNEIAGLSEQDRVARQRKVLALLDDFDRPHAELYKEFGLEVPAVLRLYDSLGRFRDPLLGHEWRSAQDEVKRKRLAQIVGTFSACAPPIPDESLHR